MVREDLATLADDGDDRRRGMASIVQLTDLHLVLGPPETHNTELGLRAPFDLRNVGRAAPSEAGGCGPGGNCVRDEGGTPGWILGGAVGAAALVGGAVALRTHRSAGRRPDQVVDEAELGDDRG